MRKTIRNYGLAVLLCCLCVLLTACSREYTVTFDLNGGTLLSGELVQTVEEGQSAAAPQAELDNYRLSWDRNFSAITEDTVVTAKWLPIRYKVTFELNGGELISGKTEQVVNAGSAAEAPEAVNGDLELSWDTDFSKITGDTVVTARWEKVKLDENMEEMTQYVQERTVSLHVRTADGSETVEAGFFIDEDGTIATTWNAIKGAAEITAIVDNGGKFSVSKIVDFSQALNLAILKIDIRSSKCLKLSDEAMQDDDTIYMADPEQRMLLPALFSDSEAAENGDIVYVLTDAIVSNESSGAPFVNAYGELVGINAIRFTDDDDSYGLALQIGTLEKLNRGKNWHGRNWTMQKFSSWYADEAAHSYSAPDDKNEYERSTVNTYQAVTNRTCKFSIADGKRLEGYVDCCETYAYTYDKAELDQYIVYLESRGFTHYESKADDGEVTMIYLKENEHLTIVLVVVTIPNGSDLLGISVKGFF